MVRPVPFPATSTSTALWTVPIFLEGRYKMRKICEAGGCGKPVSWKEKYYNKLLAETLIYYYCDECGTRIQKRMKLNGHTAEWIKV